jgi:hypothetical protein
MKCPPPLESRATTRFPLPRGNETKWRNREAPAIRRANSTFGWTLGGQKLAARGFPDSASPNLLLPSQPVATSA